MSAAVDPALAILTDEQLVAAGTSLRRAYIEASPGSGKTTVAAQRFGFQRYAARRTDVGADDRAVVAVSFTRSATWELRQRVRQSWGPSALCWPHRVVTLDTLIYSLLEYLLETSQIRWPGGHCHLDVHDSWKAVAEFFWIRGIAGLNLDGQQVTVWGGYARNSAMRVNPQQYQAAIEAGICTHEEVRDVLDLALQLPWIAESLVQRLAMTVRALIVDEIFDANSLDIAVIELAARVCPVTVVGDPWQALYGFRGARPDEVPGLLARTGMVRLPLSVSFRWRTEEQRLLADRLREGEGVTLPSGPDDNVHVVLACQWKQLWETGPHVLPLAYGSAKGSMPEAAATLLLNQLTRTVFGENATYLSDALATLGITDRDAPRRLEPALQAVIEDLASGGRAALNTAYQSLVTAIRSESRREFPAVHWRYTQRLDDLRNRLSYSGQLIPGMTVHQAKGREWNCVGVRLSEEDRATLAAGLRVDNERHRQLYVACTRARFSTTSV
jgi:DNA helicase II / ATP-dependent DNA helicase PcrA